MSDKVVVENYNPDWSEHFNQLKAAIWPSIKDIATAIEHVGSTSVIGLAAKPIIDIDIVIDSLDVLPVVIERIRPLGYEHRGNLGIEGREAFSVRDNNIRHNLYVCDKNSVAFLNHILLRDRLRIDPDAREMYSNLKKNLANRFPDSIDSYIEGKTAFILDILRSGGIKSLELNAIRDANKAK